MSNYFFPIGLTVNRFSQTLAFLFSLLLSLVLSQNSAHSQCAPAAPIAPTALLVASVAPTPPTVTPISGLVAHWKFDEGTGTTPCDSSGNDNTGSLFNGPLWTAGRVGNALYFDGIDDVVTVAHSTSLNLSTSFTLSAWVNPAATLTDWKAILVKNSSYYLFASTAGWCGDGSASGAFSAASLYNVCQPSPLVPNSWSYLTLVYDGSTLTLYQNSVAASAFSISTTVSPTTKTLHIGGSQFGEYFKGLIDEVRIYNRALSNSEIQAIYQQESVETSQTVATPIISPNGGSFTSPVPVTMQTATSGASIYYTTNGSTPTQSSTLYASAMTLGNSATMKAKAFKSGSNPSGESSASFTIAAHVLITGVTRYADNTLSANCTSGNYSIANRTCTGSAGNAYTTIEAAGAGLSAGDIVNVRQSSTAYGGTSAEGNSTIDLAVIGTGTNGNNIVIQKYPGDSGTARVIGLNANAVSPPGTPKYITFKDLIFDGADSGNLIGAGGIGLRLENLEIKNFRHHGILGLGSSQVINTKIYHNGKQTTPDACRIEAGGGCHGLYTGTGETFINNLIDGGEIYDNAHFGLHCYHSCSGTVIRNVRIHHNGTGVILSCFNTACATPNTVYNVVVDNNTNYGIWIAVSNVSLLNASVYANNGGVCVDSSGTTVRNVIAVQNSGFQIASNCNSGTYSYTSNNNLTSGSASDYFVDANNGNFKLISTSMGAGADVSLFDD